MEKTILFPVYIGDDVYIWSGGDVRCAKVGQINIDETDIKYLVYGYGFYSIADFGQEFFETREECLAYRAFIERNCNND